MNGEQLFDMYSDMVDAVNELNKEVNADFNHGSGFENQQDREIFVKLFNLKFKDVTDKYEALKVALLNKNYVLR